MTHDVAELAQTLFEEIGDAAFIADPETLRLLDVNPMAQRMTRLPRGELLRVPLDQLFRSENEGGIEHLQRALNTTQTFHSQDGYSLRSGRGESWVPVNLTLTRLHTERGQLGLVLARDATERVRAEELLRLANATLERRVQERTAELVRVNEALDRALAEHERAAVALRESEERFRGAFDHTGVATVLTGIDNRFFRVNSAFAELFGYPASEMTGMSMADVTHEDDLAASYAGRESLLAGEREFFQIEKRYRHKDGRTFWGVTSVSLVRDPTGRPYMYVGQVQDVTERKRAEQRLTAQHAVVNILADAPGLQEAAPRLLRAVCETTGWVVGELWVVDRRTNVLTCVDVWHTGGAATAAFRDLSLRMTFPSGQGLPGRVWAAAQPAWIGDVSRDAGFARAAAATEAGLRGGFGFPIQFEGAVLGVAGFYSRESAPPDEDLLRLYSSLGTQIGQYLARKRSQEGLLLFRSLIDQVRDSIEVIDPDTARILDVNAAACASHGYERAEYLELKVTDLDPTMSAPGVWEQHVEAVRRAGSLILEGQHRRKDGSLFPIEVHVSHIRDPRAYLVAVVRDITERKQLEDQFRQVAKMDAIGRLAGGVAHDFNNLLTVINGSGALMLDNLTPGDPNRELVRAVVDSGERAVGLTRQLLAFGRKALTDPKVLDLKELVANMERMLRRLVGEDIALTFAVDPETGHVKADAGQLEQVLLNLVVNARDAVPRGGSIAIEVRNAELDESYTRLNPDVSPGPYALVTVTDTGCGMDQSTISRIFEPFFTTKGKHGTGIGLATVHGIVKQCGGHVGVHSELGHGTTFRVYLPRVAKPPSEAVPRPTRGAPPSGTETVLLVEDEDGVRALTRHILIGCGYSVLEARDGAEAIRLSDEYAGRIEVLVTDVVLPGVGGREVAERVSGTHPGIKVLLLSGYTDDEIVRHGILEAQVAFLQKPYTPVSLAIKVREVLDGSG